MRGQQFRRLLDPDERKTVISEKEAFEKLPEAMPKLIKDHGALFLGSREGAPVGLDHWRRTRPAADAAPDRTRREER